MRLEPGADQHVQSARQQPGFEPRGPQALSVELYGTRRTLRDLDANGPSARPPHPSSFGVSSQEKLHHRTDALKSAGGIERNDYEPPIVWHYPAAPTYEA